MSQGKAWAVQLAPSFTPTPTLSLTPALHAAGHVLAAAAPFVLGAAAAAGAVFLTREALRGLGVLDEAERQAALAVSENRADVLAWDRTFAEVLVRNVRIARLTAQATGVADSGATPSPFVYDGRPMAAVAQWCAATDAELEQAERRVAHARIHAAVHRPRSPQADVVYQRVARSLIGRAVRETPVADDAPPTSTPPPSTSPSPPAQTGPAGPVPVGPRPDAPSSSGPRPLVPSNPPTRDPAPLDLQPVVDQILLSAMGSISGDELATLTDKAAEVLAQRRVTAAKTQLGELYVLAHDARLRQERRTTDATHAAMWLIALAPLEAQQDGANEHQLRVLAALREVLAERRELDPVLRCAAGDLVRLTEQAAADRAISTVFRRELHAMGYAVEVTHATPGSPERVAVTHPVRGAGHWIDIDVHGNDLDATFRQSGEVGQAPAFLANWVDDVVAARRAAAEHGVWNGELHISDDPRPPERRRPSDTTSDLDHRPKPARKPIERPIPTS